MRQWIRERRFDLWPIQRKAVAPILSGRRDVLIAAGTARGKTEAAFLPIVSRLAGSRDRERRRQAQPSAAGAGCLVVSPLKALIDDQFERLSGLGRRAQIEVHARHGDVSEARKDRFLAQPSGILLSTPETLEALFILHGWQLERLFGRLFYVVIDELHAFFGNERGRQLQSLLHRLDRVVGRPVPRIGLSGTLGDLDRTVEMLRPGSGKKVVRVIEERILKGRLFLRVVALPDPAPSGREELGDELRPVAERLLAVLRGGNHLVFANSRKRVEQLTALLRQLAADRGLPESFLTHHGNLSAKERREAEGALRDPGRKVSVVCTSTLELGLDVGTVETVVQVGAPPSGAALRQRLGRSGRRGGEPTMRLYVQERSPSLSRPYQDLLHVELVQTVAMVRLMSARWYEPPRQDLLHLSTLVQQLLSLIAQKGGLARREAFDILCASGPFQVEPTAFKELLEALRSRKLVESSPRGDLLLGAAGERRVNDYRFYSAFSSPVEYRLFADGVFLGTITQPLGRGSRLIFAGRHWRVSRIKGRRIELQPAEGGEPPAFGGAGITIHDRVRHEMAQVYIDDEVPDFLDKAARKRLDEARAAYVRLGLATRALVAEGADTLLFPWVGDRSLHTLRLWLEARGQRVESQGMALALRERSPSQSVEVLARLAEEGAPERDELAARVANRWAGKFGRYLPPELLRADYAVFALDPPGARRALENLLAGVPSDRAVSRASRGRTSITATLIDRALKRIAGDPEKAAAAARRTLDAVGGDPDAALTRWILRQASETGLYTMPIRLVPGVPIALGLDLALLFRRMSHVCWGIGAIKGCRLRGMLDLEGILALWSGAGTLIQLKAGSGTPPDEVTRAFGAAGGETGARAGAGADAPLAALTGRLVGEQVARMTAEKIMAKLAAKGVEGAIPIAGAVTAGAINFYLIKSVAKSAKVYYDEVGTLELPEG